MQVKEGYKCIQNLYSKTLKFITQDKKAIHMIGKRLVICQYE